MTIREELFTQGKAIFTQDGRYDDVSVIVQNANPALCQDDIEEVYHLIESIIRQRESELTLFKQQAYKWYDRLKAAYIRGALSR